MRKTGRYAVASIPMHGREHIVIIRPSESGLVAHTMFFENELHKASRPAAASRNLDKKEMDMAARLIDSLAGPFEPGQYKDEYRKNVERLIEAKRKGRELTMAPPPDVKPVQDILQALQQSLEKGRGAKSAPKRKARAA